MFLAKRCGKPKQFEEQGIKLNGSASNYKFMDPPLTYSCMEGFILVTTPGMKTTIFCNSQGRWSNEDDVDSPECRREYFYCKFHCFLMEELRGRIKLDPAIFKLTEIGCDVVVCLVHPRSALNFRCSRQTLEIWFSTYSFSTDLNQSD